MGIMQDKSSMALAITTALRGAGGGGGGSARQPIESPDSLRSIAYARIVDLVGEGEIYGFADQANPLSCVYLNETPVANPDGSLNFRNIQIDSRVGTQTQDPLPNFDGVESELSVGVELRQGTPWVRSITNLNLDSIRVRLSTPAMSKTNVSNGDITGHYVAYRIELQTDGGVYQTKITSAFSGKTTTKYERSHRIELPHADTGWNLRVTRITANAESAAIQDATYIESYAEIIEAKLRMPMSALVSVIVDAEQFNNIPSRAYRLKGRIIRVPSNYDPDTRTYSGVWDGTFQSRYSNNPAWVFYDMALNTRYGLGHLVPNDLVDKWVLYRIAQYCDGMVDDGFGGTEPRFTCNLVLQSQGDALKVMQDLATVFRGIMYATGGSITAVGDMPEDPVYTYTPANVVDGKFLYSGSDRKVRHTVALVSWNDLSDFGRAKVEYVEDVEGIQRYGIQQTEITAIGCTSRGQARRWGRYLLATERWETDTVAFSVGLDGTVVAPGKVVNIADPLRSGERRGGRIRSATSLSVEVDFMSISAVAGDTLVVTLPTGVAERREIQAIAGNDIVVTEAFSQIPVPQSVWAVDSVDIPLERYRILGVAEDKGESLGFVLHGIKHMSAKFAFSDTGVMIDVPGIPPVPAGAVPPPTGLVVTHRDVSDQNTTQKVVNVEWDAVLVANSYNVLWRQSNGQWVDLGTTGFTNIDITGVLPGGFEVQVMAINAFGVRSVPAFGGPYEIPVVGTPPGYVEDINNDIAQEVVDRFNADAEVAANAAADATAKANAALAAAQAYADVIAAQLNDIIEADEWNAVTAYVVGDIVQHAGKLYRAETNNTNQQPDTNPDDWLLMGNYRSLGEAVAANIALSTQNASDIDAVSTTLDAVVARMPAGVGLVATQASVADEATARASADTALGNRITVVEARMPAGSGTLATASALATLQAQVTTIDGVVTSQGTAITGVQASLAGIGAENLLPNSSFEEQATTQRARHWTATNGGSGTITGFLGSFVASPLPNSTNALRLEASAVAATRYLESSQYQPDGFPLAKAQPGQRHTLSVSARGTPGAEFRMYIQYVNASDATIQTATLPATPITDTFTRYTLTSAAAPAGTVSVRVYAGRLLGAAGDPARYLELDNVQLQEGTTATAYQPSVSIGLANNASAVSLLDGRVTTVEGTVTLQGTAITNVQAAIENKPGYLSGGFENAAEWSTSAQYTIVSNAANARSGNNYLRAASGAAGAAINPTAYMAVAGGQTLRVGFWAKNGGSVPNGYVRMAVRWYDGSKVQTNFVAIPGATLNASAAWTKAEGSITVPAGTAYARVAIQTGHTSGEWFVDDAFCEIDSELATANATALTSLDARVTTAEGAITATSSALTAVRAELAGGGNILQNSGFEVGVDPWVLQQNDGGWAGGSLTRDLAGDTWRPVGMHNIGYSSAGTPSAANNAIIRSAFVPVTAGKRYMFSAYIAAHRAGAYLQIIWLNADGSSATGTTTSTVGNITTNISNGGNTLTNWSFCYTPNDATAVAPVGTYQAYVRVVAPGLGIANPYVWMVRPQFEEVGPQQTVPSKWGESAGGLDSKYASVTQSLTASVTTAQNGVNTLNARYTLALNVNGYVSGIRSENTGTTSSFDILADTVRILSPAGGARIEMSSSNIRVYDTGGNLRVRLGIW